MPRGGFRLGAGRKVGTGLGVKHAATITKEAAREALRTVVLARMQALLDAQLANAEGLKYLVTRDRRTGKFIRVGAAMAGKAGEETIEVWEKDPSIAAFTDLMNRALDKPKEQEQDINLNVWRPLFTLPAGAQVQVHRETLLVEAGKD